MSHKLAKVIKYNKCNYQASKSASSIKAHGRRLGDRLLHYGSITNVATGTFAGLMKYLGAGRVLPAIGIQLFSQRVLPALHLPTSSLRETELPYSEGRANSAFSRFVAPSLKARRGPLQSCHPLMHILSSVTLAMLVLALPVFFSSATYATPYSMTVSIDDSVLDMNVSPSQAGAFSKSSNSTVSVSTTNASGYTLSIASSNRNDGKLVDSNNDDNNTNYLSSITSATTEEQFKALDGIAYNNMWGYLPSKWDGQANTSYLPSPTTTGDVLDHTTAANTTANTYTLSIGARVDATQKVGSYTNTYVVLATANGTPYTITYKDDTITGFPTDESSTAAEETVQISTDTPTKPGYTFLGWCTATPTLNTNGTDTCSHGTNGAPEYTPGSTWTIDQTADTNNLVLYAMWGGNYTIEAFVAAGGSMQDFNTMDTDKKAKIVASMPIGQQYQLKDNRDNIKYWVAKQADGKVWMTQNLDLCVGCTGVAALTSDNTDLNTYGSGAYATDYNMTNGVVTWAPVKTGTEHDDASPITSDQVAPSSDGEMSWNSSEIYPWSAEGGTIYIYTSGNTDNDTIYASLSACIDDDHSAAECAHYHRGNYYNWTEAIASSDSTDISAQYQVAENSICPAGWRLPKALSGPSSNASTREFGQLFYASGITANIATSAYIPGGFAQIRSNPLFLIRSGGMWNNALRQFATIGRYWASSLNSVHLPYDLVFDTTYLGTANTGDNRVNGHSVRCLLR